MPAAAQNDESEQIKAEYEAKMAEMNVSKGPGDRQPSSWRLGVQGPH